MKSVFLLCLSVCLSLPAFAGDVVTDQGLSPKCSQLAEAYFQEQNTQEQPKLVDIYVVDESTPEKPKVNNWVQIEMYKSGNQILFTSQNEIAEFNPSGRCHIILRNDGSGWK